MRGHNVEKASFGFGITQSLQSFEMRRFDAHKNRIWLDDHHGAP